ncbi:hypothetical protein IHE45_05G062300 [Dioscorea alata]|uniref:Uncharacterized protein n=1 Tax=Dioscorea alata TaxID=55571 RepID=A0ACB7W206_DIOAL|nr:hypothetical protein IHE45_05G062300 [Dioscorea alata]
MSLVNLKAFEHFVGEQKVVQSMNFNKFRSTSFSRGMDSQTKLLIRSPSSFKGARNFVVEDFV